jgi:hypothetical protein
LHKNTCIAPRKGTNIKKIMCKRSIRKIFCGFMK